MKSYRMGEYKKLSCIEMFFERKCIFRNKHNKVYFDGRERVVIFFLLQTLYRAHKKELGKHGCMFKRPLIKETISKFNTWVTNKINVMESDMLKIRNSQFKWMIQKKIFKQ